MPPTTGASSIVLQLEDVNDIIPLLVEQSNTLDARIKDGRSKRVSTKSFRVRIQTALTGALEMIDLDGGSLPDGGGSDWDQFTVTPLAYAVPIQYTRLADLVGEPGDVATLNPVSKTIADAAIYIRRSRDVLLQTAGDGQFATVGAAAIYTAGNNPIVLTPTPWGARNLAKGQTIQVFNSAKTINRGRALITNVNNILGATQSIQVNAVPPGTTNGDFIMIGGIGLNGAPCVNGIPVFHSTSTAGTLMGISRSNSYVVANGVDIAGAQITLPVLMTCYSQVEQALGPDGLKSQVWHTHESQIQAYAEIGFNLQQITMANGEAQKFDGIFKGYSIEGREIIKNIHADQTRWDLMNLKSWGKVKWGNPPFWFKNRGGQTVFQGYDTTTGNPKTTEKSYLVDALQYYVDNPKVLSSVTTCKVPANN